jgi:hypothetical protein
MADPIRQEFSDPALVDYIDRQRDRLTDANGAPVRSDFEPFEPAVQRRDIRLESPVGAEEANHPLAVYNAKKLLSAAGFHDFAPGIEGMGEASPRFLADLRRFQAAHDLDPDAVAQPGGPTVHMLTRKVFGLADGPPPDSETEHFKERFGSDPNRTLSGQPIFGGPDGAGVEASDTEFQEAGWRGGRGGKLPGGKRVRKLLEDLIRRTLESPSSRSPKYWPKFEKPTIVETPVTIYRYPDGRLYIRVDGQGNIYSREGQPGSISIVELNTNDRVEGLRFTNKRYPKLGDKRSFEERRAPGEEEYVYGRVYDEKGRHTGWTPLFDPRSKQLLRAPVGKPIFLDDEQIRRMGLSRWHRR